MDWDYLYDESEKTLTPFFSEPIISYNFRCLIIAGMVLLLMWPKLPFYTFLEASHAPILFFQVFATVTILCSYLSLRCGRGEMVQTDSFAEYYKEPSSFERERNFFTYGLVEFLLHTAFLILPFIPILVIAAAVSCIPFTPFAKAVIVLYATALLCRTMGFAIYLTGGKLSYSGYFIARVFIIFYLFATALFYARSNPLVVLYRLNKDVTASGNLLDTLFVEYAVVAGITICILIFVCYFMILRYTHRIKET